MYSVLGSRLPLWSKCRGDCAGWEEGIVRIGRGNYLGKGFFSVSSSGCWFHRCVHFMTIIKLQACDLCIALNICYTFIFKKINHDNFKTHNLLRKFLRAGFHNVCSFRISFLVILVIITTGNSFPIKINCVILVILGVKQG